MKTTVIINCDLSVTVEGRIEAKNVDEAKDILRKRIDRLFCSDDFTSLMYRLNKEDYDDLGVFYAIETIKAKDDQ